MSEKPNWRWRIGHKLIASGEHRVAEDLLGEPATNLLSQTEKVLSARTTVVLDLSFKVLGVELVKGGLVVAPTLSDSPPDSDERQLHLVNSISFDFPLITGLARRLQCIVP